MSNEFLLVESETEKHLDELLTSTKVEHLLSDGFTLKKGPIKFKHILSHQVIFASFYQLYVENDFSNLPTSSTEVIDIEDINSLPVSRLTHKYLEQSGKEQQTLFNF